jgi:hypothetical protein
VTSVWGPILCSHLGMRPQIMQICRANASVPPATGDIARVGRPDPLRRFLTMWPTTISLGGRPWFRIPCKIAPSWLKVPLRGRLSSQKAAQKDGFGG